MGSGPGYRKLSVWALCAADWVIPCAHAAATTPFTSPPWDADAIPQVLPRATRHPLVYLNLCGFPDQDDFFGQRDGQPGPAVLTPDIIEHFSWHGCTIFAEVPYSAADEGGPIARAFLDNGALAFIGSLNGAAGHTTPALLDPKANRIFWLFRHAFARIQEPDRAFSHTKHLLRAASYPLDQDDRDTLKSFVCLRPNGRPINGGIAP